MGQISSMLPVPSGQRSLTMVSLRNGNKAMPVIPVPRGLGQEDLSSKLAWFTQPDYQKRKGLGTGALCESDKPLFIQKPRTRLRVPRSQKGIANTSVARWVDNSLVQIPSRSQEAAK